MWLSCFTFVMIVCVTAQSTMKEFLCDQVLRDDHFDNKSGWNASNCALHFYDPDDVVDCLDQLTSLQSTAKQLHFAFVGDSRIRQAFLSFWPMIPDYDLEWNELPVQRMILRVHINLSVQSAVLNTRISFYWLPRINDDLFRLLQKWQNGSDDTPTAIITGYGGHHMDKNDAHSRIEYEEMLTKLVPLLKTLSSRIPVIWMHQNPIIDTNHFFAIFANPTNRKYYEYNVLSRRLLKDSGVLYWESMYPMGEQYVRSCTYNKRQQDSNYQSCYDFIHTGYSVVDRGSQILLNAMCNRLLFGNERQSQK